MTDCFNGYRFHNSSSGVFNSHLCMSFLNKLCLESGDGEGRNNRCWLDPESPEFWVTMKEDAPAAYAPATLKILREKSESQLEAILRERRELRRPKDWKVGVFRTKDEKRET